MLDFVVLLALIGVGAWLVSMFNGGGRSSWQDQIPYGHPQGAPLSYAHITRDGDGMFRYDTSTYKIPQRDPIDDLVDQLAQNDPPR